MPMLMKRLRSAAILALMCATSFAVAAEEFEILMLNAAEHDVQHNNVFAPNILHIAPGDTVTR